MEENQLLVSELYVAYFNRAPDSAGLEYWLNEIDTGLISLEQMSINWANEQQEFVDNYGTDISYETFIPQVYANILGREPDSEGLDYWLGDLNSGNVQPENFITAMINGAKATTGSADDASFLNNRAQVGIEVANAGIDDIEFAKSAVSAVTKDPATVDVVKNIVTVAKDSADGILSATTTLNTVKELIDTHSSDETILLQVIENVKTLVESVVTNIQTSSNIDIKSTLETVSTVVKAAKTDVAFIEDATSVATKVIEDADNLKVEAAAKIPSNELNDIFGDEVPSDLSDVALPSTDSNTEDNTDTPTEIVTPPAAGGGGGGTTAPTTATINVTEGNEQVNSYNAGTLDNTFNFTADTYTYYTFNFGTGDKLVFPSTANPTIINSNFADENIIVQWADNGNVITADLGISLEADAQIIGIDSFKTVFGETSISTIANVSSDSTTYFASSNQTIDVASTDATINFTEGTYTYTINNFNDGDVLDFPSSMDATIINESFTDGAITVQWAANGNVITANLTIPTADDATIIGVSSFEAAFGADSIA